MYTWCPAFSANVQKPFVTTYRNTILMFFGVVHNSAEVNKIS